jgi:hypothetical protein
MGTREEIVDECFKSQAKTNAIGKMGMGVAVKGIHLGWLIHHSGQDLVKPVSACLEAASGM